jgi:pimeloyl-ACP methyl ester carboxylesterase
VATYVLIHGAGSEAWYWHLVEPLLRARGHDVVAPNLPSEDDSAGLAEYADVVVDAVGDRRDDLIVVAQSLAGFTAPLVCDRVPVRLMVLLAAMVPRTGERPADWWENTGWQDARSEAARRAARAESADFDLVYDFFHDVPPDVTERTFARGERQQSGRPMEEPWPLVAWPNVPTRFLLCSDDHFFPAEFMRRVVRDRLGIEPDEMVSGHLPALAHPDELVERLEAYRIEEGLT